MAERIGSAVSNEDEQYLAAKESSSHRKQALSGKSISPTIHHDAENLEPEIFTPDKENLTPSSHMLKRLQDIGDVKDSKSSSKLSGKSCSSLIHSSIAIVTSGGFTEPEIFTPDKENLTPSSHMLKRLRDVGEIKDTKGSSSKVTRKPFFDIHLEENVMAEQELHNMSNKSKVKHEPVAPKKKAERAPFQLLLEKSSSQSQSYTEASSTALTRNNVSRGIRSSSVVSDNKLPKHLQQKVATKLESELRSPESSSSTCLKSLLIEKEMKIQQMESEMKELKRQRDIAQCKLDLERKAKELKGSNECEPISQGTPVSRQANSFNLKRIERMFMNAVEEFISNIESYVTGLKEHVAKLQFQKQLLFGQVSELEATETGAASESNTNDESQMDWPLCFEEQRKQIIMLWHLCHISIIHRTQFYMLFKGEPADQIYMEVELRRLTWLEQHLAELGNASPAFPSNASPAFPSNASPALLGDKPTSFIASRIRALKQEREYLEKRVNTKLEVEEREMLYLKWDVPPVGKQRRHEFINKLWTNPHNIQHVKESAAIVAKLVGFCDPGAGEKIRKEMFELNFASPSDKKMGWNFISNLLHL